MRHILLVLTLLGIFLLGTALTIAQDPLKAPPAAPKEDAPAAPQLSERDVLVLTVLQQQVELATIRLQKAAADLKQPGWQVDLVEGRWQYVAVPKVPR